MTELWALSAVEVTRGVRTGVFSAREVVDACLERIAASNPRLNALVEVSGDEARAAAGEADAAARRGAALGAMQGVPVAVKANTDEAGHATTNGVPAWADRIAERDAPHIERMRVAGAMFVGRSNTPAL